MVARGIIPRLLPNGVDIVCTLDDAGVADRARALRTTRSAAAVDIWAERIDGAILAPLSQMPAAWEALDLPADKKIIVQCLKGGRSHQVCAFVGPTAAQGQPVFNLTGGIQAWHAAGLPIIEG